MDKKILIYGYGNPGRMDDGLGNRFVEIMEEWAKENKIENVGFDSNYQLNIEDAENISGYDVVLFVDASEEPIDSFIMTKVDPSDSKIEFTMHAVSCSYIVDLCIKMYNKSPETYLLHIKGYEWEFEEQITEKATENLEKSLALVKTILMGNRSFKEYANAETPRFWNN
ncbi:MAG: hypothetical protein A2W91_19535 [Bacteroidetes bacterium GWF2_38_335]|nr:MAG: hypothetical protein A2W91_19535 [Bacteroidetes bacterium GWF2_38_335]OFY79950.1 MAG: hypothetical protein A2281_10935 [Bacteroidetes bacterium RIFOXYA12_FULL_38_20]HBS86409.1 Ni/Fe hydrogenase [Bacteroidales bacterium]